MADAKCDNGQIQAFPSAFHRIGCLGEGSVRPVSTTVGAVVRNRGQHGVVQVTVGGQEAS